MALHIQSFQTLINKNILFQFLQLHYMEIRSFVKHHLDYEKE